MPAECTTMIWLPIIMPFEWGMVISCNGFLGLDVSTLDNRIAQKRKYQADMSAGVCAVQVAVNLILTVASCTALSPQKK